LQGAPPRIEEEFLASGFDQNARPESVHDGRRTSRTQEGDRDVLGVSRGGNDAAVSSASVNTPRSIFMEQR
jgi:hypothetical protein